MNEKIKFEVVCVSLNSNSSTNICLPLESSNFVSSSGKFNKIEQHF